MPFSDMPVDELIVRSLPLVVLLLSGVFCGVSALRARGRRRRGEPVPGVYPGSAEHQAALRAAGVASMAGWQQLPAEVQEAADNAVLDAQEAAEDAVRRAVDAQIQAAIAEAVKRNALFHP